MLLPGAVGVVLRSAAAPATREYRRPLPRKLEAAHNDIGGASYRLALAMAKRVLWKLMIRAAPAELAGANRH